jgi:hypothetical protein
VFLLEQVEFGRKGEDIEGYERTWTIWEGKR